MKLSEKSKEEISKEFSFFKEKQYNNKSKEERKKLNQFFTPPEVSIKMIEQFNDLTGTVFDPGCGSSNLLMAFAIAKKIELNENSEQISKEIFGSDIDEKMVELSKKRFETAFGVSFNITKDDYSVSSKRKYNKGIANPPFNKSGARLIELEFLKGLIRDCDESVMLGTTTNIMDICGDLKRGEKYIKYKDVLNHHLEKIELVKGSDNYFDIFLAKDLGIMKIIKNASSNYDDFRFIKNNANYKFIYDKVYSKVNDSKISLKSHWADKSKLKDLTNYIPLKVLVSFNNYNIVNKNFKKATAKKNETEEKKTKWNVARGLLLDKSQWNNFYKSVTNEFYFFLVKYALTGQNIKNINKFLPYMEDYNKVWTNEDYFKFFKISKEEGEKIIEEMENYTLDFNK